MKYRTLAAGLISPLLAVFFYVLVYTILTNRSSDTEKDWLYRLSISSLSMTVPFVITVSLALSDTRKRSLGRSGKIGLCVAALSLILIAKPITDGVMRWKQVQNQSLRGVPAPLFSTLDINGTTQRLSEHRGQVVLINIWATWCGPCRTEMPLLDRLYRDREGRGLIIFGISAETPAVQQKFLAKVLVSYPLLTVNGDVPNLYRDIARFPASFLIDRQGNLQPVPDPEQSFDKLVSSVDSLLGAPAQANSGGKRP